MPKLTYNLDDIPDAPPSLPAGLYKLLLKACVKTQSKAKNDMLKWTWKVKGGNHEGETVFTYTSLLDTALSGLKEHLTAFGLHGNITQSTDKLIGSYVGALVEERKGQNRLGEEIDTTGVTMIMSLERYKQMKAKMEAKGIPATKNKPGKKPEPEEEEGEEEEEDDDEE